MYSWLVTTKRFCRLLGVVLCAGCVAASTAQADAAPQIDSLQGSLLATAPAPPHTNSLCLIDTGVNVNPGDQAALIARSALDGGSPDDNVGHGTLMADALATPAGAWGVTGLWPQVKLISVRVTDSSGGITIADVASGISACQSAGASVINVSLAGPSLGTEGPALQSAIDSATNAGILVVAGAGDNGGAVEYPAALPGVLGVGGIDSSGNYCSDSARGPQVQIVAPGCNLVVSQVDGTDTIGDGTSFSSAYVAGAAAALESYSGLSATQAESVLIQSATSTASGPELNVASAFNDVGLGGMEPPLPTGPVATPAAPAPTHPARPVAAPRGVVARWQHGRIRVSIKRLPAHLSLIVRARGATFTSTRSSLVLPVARVGSVQVAYLSSAGARSRWVRIRVR